MSTISIIKWGNRYHDSYTYGSEIILNQSCVHFSSPMMPVGAKIKTWYSLGTYSEVRVSPLLPLLIGDKRYRLTLFLQKNDQNSLQVIIEFYDKHHNKIGIKYSNVLTFTFIYPRDAVSYQIHLVNKQHEQLVFYFMTLLELSNEDKYDMSMGEDLSILKWDDPNPADKLNLVIHYLARETTVVERSGDNSNELHFFVTGDEKSFLKSLVTIVKYLRKQTKGIQISRGASFDQLPTFYQLLPNVLTALFPDSRFSTDIVNQNGEQTNREIVQYVSTVQQMLSQNNSEE